MGNRINRIETEFILNGVVENEIRLQLHGEKKEAAGRLVDYDENFMEIELHNQIALEDDEHIRVFFFFKNNMHAFDGSIRIGDDGHIFIKYSEGLYKNLQRKHERIKNPQDIAISFMLKGLTVELSFPKTNSFVELEKPSISGNFDETSIESLIEGFRVDMQQKVSFNEIIMMRNRAPDKFEEEVLHKTSKIFWMPSTQLGFPLKDPGIEAPVLTKQDLLQFDKESGVANTVLKSRLDNYLFEKSKNNIFSEAYCPILYKQFLIGYVHIGNTMDRKEKIGKEILDYVYNFTKILCYSLELNGYLKSEKDVDTRYDAEIIDISASGLLFTHPNRDLGSSLLIHTDLPITVYVKKRKIGIGSRVIRKLIDRKRIYIGLQFLDIYPEDYRYLFEVIYGKSFEEFYDDTWEGGIPPPELKLD